MAQQREVATDRLVGIIANIKIERRNGRLTVRRGEGLAAEEGTLVFIQGQITQASIGKRNGSDALNRLSTWAQARYIFESTDADSQPSLFSPVPSSSPGIMADTSPFLAGQADTDPLEPVKVGSRAYDVPYTTVELSEALARLDKAGLSRSHKRLYLLIDGHRSAIELPRLMGKKVEEVRNMLNDLEWLGILRISGRPAPRL